MDNNNNIIKLTQLDSKEIPRYTYDEENNANRVILVGTELGNVGEYIKEGLKDLKIDFPVTVDAPKIVKEYFPGPVQKIEVPIIIKEQEIVYKEIQIPVIQTEVKVIEIEKPIIHKEIVLQKVEVPLIVREKEIQTVYIDRLNYKLLFIFQLITLILLLVSKFVK